jgi:hypothetical protein
MLRLRLVLLVLSLVVAGWFSISSFAAFRATPDQINFVAYDEYTAKMLDFMRSDVDRLFQLVVLMFAGLWALAFLDKDHRLSPTVRDIPELIMCGLAMALLVAFFYFDFKYGEVLKQVYWDIGKLPGPSRRFPDPLNSPYILLHQVVLVRCFYSGLVVSALAAFSLVRLRQT